MITVSYELWNGRECGCCCEYHIEESQFENEQSAVAGCITIASENHWHINIKSISGVGNAGELMLKIDKAVDAEQAQSEAKARA